MKGFAIPVQRLVGLYLLGDTQSSTEENEELFFALSSGDRLKLLSEIRVNDLRLTDLADHLSSSVQETSKHLGRLVDCKLVEKTSGGTYRMTQYGSLISKVLPSLNFVSSRRKYFLTHDISILPQYFILRIGQLTECRFHDHVSNVLLECQHLLGMAEKYFAWSIDEPLPWFITKKFESDTSIRVLLPTTTTVESMQEAKQIVGGRADFRFAENIRAGVAVNEKVAGVVFPDLEGKLDYSSGFVGYSPDFQKWCLDLFDWMWDSASPLWPQELERQMSRNMKID